MKDLSGSRASAGLLRQVFAGDVREDPLTLAMYSTDASVYQLQPRAVAFPRDSADVSAAMKFAREHQTAIAARGTGSGLAGESLTQGLLLDFSQKMTDLGPIAEDGNSIVAAPGAVLTTINAALADHGKQIGPDPSGASRATVGGMIGNNATGAHSLVYGHTADHLRWVEAVLVDGTRVRFHTAGTAEPLDGRSTLLDDLQHEIPDILRKVAPEVKRRWPNLSRNRAGYALRQSLNADGTVNWPRLIAGSEGTLAVVTAASLGLVDLPTHRTLIRVDCESVEAMAAALKPIVSAGAATCDLIDGKLMEMARDAYPEDQLLLPDVAASLLVSMEAGSAPQLERKVTDALRAVVGLSGIAGDPVVLRSPHDQQRTWAVRKRAMPLLYRVRGNGQPVPIVEDLSVPVEHMAELLDGMNRIAREEDLIFAASGHPGDGEPHIRPYIDLHRSDEREKYARVARKSFELVWSLGGSISGEHGCGLLRAGFIGEQYGDLYDAMRRIKRAFDPDGLLNPGKVIADVPGEELMVRDLRYEHPNTGAVSGSTELHWRRDELVNEMEACNGCGECRSVDPRQSMCPVYKALGSEASAPRSTANLMRHLETGLLDSGWIRSDEARAVADSCINCKMCLVDCPSAVDIPKLAMEIKARHVAVHGLQKPQRVLAAGETMSRLNSRVAPLANFMLRRKSFRRGMEKITGVDRRRPMPAFSFGDGLRRLRRHLRNKPRLRRPIDRVVYFVDLVPRWNDPSLGMAVIDVLHRNGIQVELPGQKSAAMPAIDYLDLPSARKTIADNVRLLLPWVRNGCKIVCSEPTAALCLKEEWLNLVDDDGARRIAESSWELMAYLASLQKKGRLDRDFGRVEQHFAYQQPCHMRSMQQGDPTRLVLSGIPGVEVDHIDRGCCGIAGTWGFQKRNYDLSCRMAEPVIRRMEEIPGTLCLCECSTCRMQLSHLGSKPVIHPVRVLAAAYGCGSEGEHLDAAPAAGR